MCEYGVNSRKAEMPTMSQAGMGFIFPEGAETTRVSPNNNPLHERPTLDKTYLREHTNRMPKGKKWTTEQVAWLEENYGLLGCAECAKRLNRTTSAISHEANRLGLIRKSSDKMGRASRPVIRDGYIWISDSDSRYALHRRLMEQKIGRRLSVDELVHHIDGNTMNNDINNLQLTNRSEHMKIHAKRRNFKGQFTSDKIVRTVGKDELTEIGDKEPLW